MMQQVLVISAVGCVVSVVAGVLVRRAAAPLRSRAQELFRITADMQARLRDAVGVGSESHLAQVAANERHHAEHPDRPLDAPLVVLPKAPAGLLGDYRDLCEEESAVRAQLRRLHGRSSWCDAIALLCLVIVTISALAIAFES